MLFKYKKLGHLNLNTKDLSSKIGVFPKTIIYIKLDRYSISFSTLRKLSVILNASIVHLGCFNTMPEDTLGQKIKKPAIIMDILKEKLVNL